MAADIKDLITSDPELKKGYEVLESDARQANLAAHQANLRVIHTTPSDGNPLVCVVGVGYVGEILLKEFGSIFPAIGFDLSESRLEDLQASFSPLKTVRLSSDLSILREATHFCISVPTLLRPDKSINTDHLVRAIAMVTSQARPGSTIVIESSVSVGMTRTLLGPYSDRFHCGMSPERVDPGRTQPPAREIPKIISALSEPALLSMHKIYSQAFETVIPVSTPEVAEMTKLFENCYRMINISYVNEIADACAKHGIDADEVISAAATKPFGFQSFKPGLGVGGHCIPINPHYLMVNNDLPVLRRATADTWARPRLAARKFFQVCKQANEEPRILVIGMGFKPGQSVISCSPGVAFADELQNLGCHGLAFYDPLVEQAQIPVIRKLSEEEYSTNLVDALFDAVAVCTKQEKVDWLVLKNLTRAVVQWY
ncbi:hypothetical protein AC578_6752 [Pseudocercospora eumusae]|uniref:UDP-glucose/GDP-mannose dehydrogenase C-terminal domain-containing protein n=1 Tax=Pseudocercospora eumusae TaxID=321146 RepID=A0A139HA46_9PEZI|nr:hypothetical protein AC578_6752 [Pseudocercospora eumusae]